MQEPLVQIPIIIIYLSIVFILVTKKNYEGIIAYAIQSLMVVFLLFRTFIETSQISFLILALIILIVKVVFSTIYFVKLINKHELKFSIKSYFNSPMTLIAIGVLTALAFSQKLLPLTSIVASNQEILAIALSSIFLSLLLIVINKGAISQILGVLSLENSIVAFATFAGLEQSLGLQIGIIFDIFVWVLISTVFVSMIYKHFGTLDVTSMRELKE
jgi:hydrogenase-4 component E